MAKQGYIREESGFFIPWDVPEKVFTKGLLRPFHAWAVCKLLCGGVFHTIPQGVKKRHLMQAVRQGWIKYDKKERCWIQKKTEEVFPFHQGCQKVFIPRSWATKDIGAALYAIEMDYLMRPTSARKKDPARKGDKQTKCLKPSEQSGGIAHSIIRSRLGISLGTSSNLRRRCEAAGFCFFKQRFRITHWATALEGHVWGDTRFLFDTKFNNGVYAQLTSSHHQVVQIEFRTHKVKFDMRAISGLEGHGYEF